jgi:hypothetical protein
VFGAGDQYLGTLTAGTILGTWTWTASGMSAPWCGMLPSPPVLWGVEVAIGVAAAVSFAAAIAMSPKAREPVSAIPRA